MMVGYWPISEDIRELLNTIKSAIDSYDEEHVVLLVNQNPKLSTALYDYAKQTLTSDSIRDFLKTRSDKLESFKNEKRKNKA